MTVKEFKNENKGTLFKKEKWLKNESGLKPKT
jgi:hypothetical protein